MSAGRCFEALRAEIMAPIYPLRLKFDSTLNLQISHRLTYPSTFQISCRILFLSVLLSRPRCRPLPTYTYKHFSNQSNVSLIICGLEMTTIAPLNQQRITLGPLTTTFTPPSECWDIAVPKTSWGSSRGYHGQSCASDHPFGQVRDILNCIIPSPYFLTHILVL